MRIAPKVGLGFFMAFSFLTILGVCAQTASGPVGRWDMTIQAPDGAYPSWLEVSKEQGTLTGRFVGRFGSARPVPKLEVNGNNLSFSLPVQFEKQSKELVFKGRLKGNKLEGTTESPDGKITPWTAVRAPALRTPTQPRWGNPVELFNGRDLTGWRLRSPKSPNCWSVENGAMTNGVPCVDIISEQKFMDFKLHVEFNIAEKSNSGIYLRGRYEIQLLDDFAKPPSSHGMGSVYGFITPSSNPAKKAGEWQTFDITFLGRSVTVVLNGQTLINNQEISGITGGALDSDEGAPGPIMLQGDHGKIAFRKITVTPAK